MHPGGKKQHRLGAALSLDKWASAKVSKYDKRKVIEKQKQLKAKQVNKYKKLKKRLEAEGKLAGSLPKVGISMLLVGHTLPKAILLWPGGLDGSIHHASKGLLLSASDDTSNVPGPSRSYTYCAWSDTSVLVIEKAC